MKMNKYYTFPYTTIMKTLQKFWIFSVVLLLIACGETDETAKKKAELAQLKKEHAELGAKIANLESELNIETVSKGVLVEVAKVVPSTFEHFIDVHGTVEADMNVQVMPEANGPIEKIYVEKGQTVSKGQTLALINTDMIRQNIKEVETSLELATSVYEKQKRLWDQKVGTEMQYLEAKNRKEGLETNLATLKTQLSKAYIKSPVSGEVDEIFGKAGEMTSAQTPFARVVNLDKVYISADVSETYIGRFSKGDPVKVHLPSLDKELDAEISAAGQFINPNNRTFRVTVNLDNQEKVLKPNMLSVVKIRDFAVDDALVVPASVIQSDRQGDYLFTVRKEGEKKVAQKTYVSTGITYKGQTVVVDGLNKNDKVITKGFRGLVDGETVSFN
ncbi:efflux RND transporter periplasmic adaptor subunit [Cytophagaceae bacterium ABcell3]|nr:efflux RND transporter periplasmic adaptor subunit [Cytophagaceae bacterium ABcell3]